MGRFTLQQVRDCCIGIHLKWLCRDNHLTRSRVHTRTHMHNNTHTIAYAQRNAVHLSVLVHQHTQCRRFIYIFIILWWHSKWLMRSHEISQHFVTIGASQSGVYCWNNYKGTRSPRPVWNTTSQIAYSEIWIKWQIFLIQTTSSNGFYWNEISEYYCNEVCF